RPIHVELRKVRLGVRVLWPWTAPGDERHQTSSIGLRQRRQPGRVEQRRREIDAAYEARDSTPGGHTRAGDGHPEPNRAFVHEKPVRCLAVLAKTFSVIADGGNQQRTVGATRVQAREELADLLIVVGNLTVVGAVAEGLGKRRRRLVRIVWIVEMQPDE